MNRERCGIPGERLTSDEQQRYAQMAATIGQRVIGQDAAVRAVSRSIRAALAGMKEPNRPIGVFHFMGSSGMGKTQLAKELATFLFNTPDALIRFDMEEAKKVGFTASESAGLRAQVAQFLRPELVNRITEVIRFAPLGRTELARILDIILAEKTQRLRNTQNINLNIDESAKDLILEISFDPHMGARPLERAVEQLIVQPLVDAIFVGQVAPGEIHVTAQAGKLVFASMTGESPMCDRTPRRMKTDHGRDARATFSQE